MQATFPFEGVRIVEVAEWTFIPAAAMLLADLGADVIKIEPPGRGDSNRALAAAGIAPSAGGVNLVMESTNRGKRSIGLDLTHTEGRKVLLGLLENADVFMTSLRPQALAKLGIGADELRAKYPCLVYVQGHGQGRRGPDAETGGYDMTAFWARSGLAYSLTAPDAKRPTRMRPGMGDKTGAMNAAFGVAAALFRRAGTGQGAVVDISLLATGLWTNSSDVVYSRALDRENSREQHALSNPLINEYQTKDGRWLVLVMLDSDKWWPDLCAHLDRPGLKDHERFSTSTARRENRDECVAVLQVEFQRHTLDEWKKRFATLAGPWSPMNSVLEALRDPQVDANNYVTVATAPSGQVIPQVQCPVQFDGRVPDIGRAPDAFQHTDEILTELGKTRADIADLRELGAVA